MPPRIKIGRGRRKFQYKGRTYLNHQNAHNHLGMRLLDIENGNIIYVKADYLIAL